MCVKERERGKEIKMQIQKEDGEERKRQKGKYFCLSDAVIFPKLFVSGLNSFTQTTVKQSYW